MKRITRKDAERAVLKRYNYYRRKSGEGDTDKLSRQIRALLDLLYGEETSEGK